MSRKKYSANFKAQVAIEAVKNDSTLIELSKKYNVHPNQIQLWKSNLIKGSEKLFVRGNNTNEDKDTYIAALERKAGQLTIENDFLKKNLMKYPKYKE